MNLTQVVGIVTGAGQGLGAHVAHTLAAAGVRVAVNDINPDRAERTAVAIQQAGGEAIAVAADVANKFQCVHLIETTRAKWRQLDILVNNAAIMPSSTILKLDEWEWNRCLEVNLKGTFFMSQLCGRVMVDENQARGGVIINIASTAGVKLPLENRAAYCASKAGVIGFARECAREYAQYGIRVHTLLPDEERPLPPSQIAQMVRTLCQNPDDEHLHSAAFGPKEL
ncbi:SDR family NAD(P)-dependent oxidoreductase [Candidatus Leptofilum sp.]|uniref:SDR family NAD(P)-dependent oxidoreductase n=1 Tax=Candidatus Leptofilum sp. TaxID=3241576 RepID=UPI003B5C5395